MGTAIGVLLLILVVGALVIAGIVGFLNALPDPAREAEAPRPIVDSATPAAAPEASGPETPGAFRDLADPDWLDRTAAAHGIPRRALAAYAAADIRTRQESQCTVGWNTLAAIGWVESRHGRLQGGSIDDDGVARPHIIGIALDGTNNTLAIPDTDGGALDGDTEWDRAVGPMQFIPETWSRWAVDAGSTGNASPHSIDDAALAAARYLCRLDGSLETEEQWIRAILSYNNSLSYQQQVATRAERYAEAAD
ncbi:transglycosylase-like protein with SLT domain [Bogoriella caseilytica]|uniref:Transglycosylase-like protein with SLT domain n=1 Tax=Bogoriella caseilytica TaxID=56055 RepID=A0A3N2BA69_9MICO|nr:transglycosylase-like protein with SLT domain [Bogoriella caseilytica]